MILKDHICNDSPTCPLCNDEGNVTGSEVYKKNNSIHKNEEKSLNNKGKKDFDLKNEPKLIGILAAKLWLRNTMLAEKLGLSYELCAEVDTLIFNLSKSSNSISIYQYCICLIKQRNEFLKDQKHLLNLIREKIKGNKLSSA
jgi:hypothetical protein